MNIEQIIANAPKGAERYYTDGSAVVYFKKDHHWVYMVDNHWNLGAGSFFWNEAIPLPKQSSENSSTEMVSDFELHGMWSHSDTTGGMTECMKTPRERFIEQAQQDGADFGAIYDEFVGGEV